MFKHILLEGLFNNKAVFFPFYFCGEVFWVGRKLSLICIFPSQCLGALQRFFLCVFSRGRERGGSKSPSLQGHLDTGASSASLPGGSLFQKVERGSSSREGGAPSEGSQRRLRPTRRETPAEAQDSSPGRDRGC